MQKNHPTQLANFRRTGPHDGRYFAHQSKKVRLVNIDLVLLCLLLGVMAIGLINLYSATGQNWAVTSKQLLSYTLAGGVMMLVSFIPPQIYQSLAPWAYVGAIALLLLVMLIGDVRLGAQRWLSIPLLGSVQPSELVKIAVPMMVAWYLASKHGAPSLKSIVVCLILIGVPVLLIAEQPDLGTALLVLGAGSFVLFFAGLSYRLIFAVVALFIAFIPVAWSLLLHDYQKQRVLTLLDPTADLHGAGWNILQSMAAIGSGGLSGKGYLGGTQSHLNFLPEAHTDFAIASFSEETGLLGVCLLLVLYTGIVGRILHIGSTVKNNFQRWLVCSIAMSFGMYVFINMAMVAGILPVVGVPLPFISYGGTAAIMLMISMGLVMSIYRHQQ